MGLAPDDTTRARQVLNLCLTIGGILLSASLIRWIVAPPSLAVTLVTFLAASIPLCAPFLFRAMGSLQALVLFVVFAEGIILISHTHASGGLYSTAIMCYPLLPLASTFYLGLRWAFFVTAVLMLDLTLLVWFDNAEHSSDFETLYRAGIPIVVTISIAVSLTIGIAYLRQSRQQRSELRTSQAALSQLNNKLERLVAERTTAGDTQLSQLGRASELAGLSFWEWDFESASLRLTHRAEPLMEQRNFVLRELLQDVHPKDTARLSNALERSIRDGAPMDLEIRLKVDGEYRSLRALAERVSAQDGNQRLAGVLQDVTDYHEAQRRRFEERKREALGAISAGLAHDFNNILTPIQGFAELLQDRVEDDDSRRYLQQISAAAERAANLVAHMLTFARQTEGEPTLVDVGTIVEETADLIKPSLGSKITLKLDVSETGGPVLADPGQLRTVLMNLVLNARDAMPDGGTLTIGLERTLLDAAPSLASQRLTVSDTGTGMHPAELERMFEPYFSTKTPEQGTGLGLALVDGVVRGVGGSVDASSTPGDGTQVVITLPEYTEPPPGTDSKGITPAPTGSILLVDDDPSVLEIARVSLAGMGHAVHPYSDPVAALTAVANGAMPVDLVLVDERMPTMDGPTLIRRLRRNLGDVPTVVMGGAIDRARLEASGIRHFLAKPFSMGALANVVARALQSELPQQQRRQ